MKTNGSQPQGGANIMSPEKTKLVNCPGCKGMAHRDSKTLHAIKRDRCNGSGVISVPDNDS
jgi:hypothetical protein